MIVAQVKGNKILIILVVAVLVAIAAPVNAQIVLSDSTPTNITFAGFTGSGFVSSPAAGQLDSDEIIATGCSDGDMAWGGTYTTGDYARGTSSGGTTTGGLYAGSDGDTFLMIQPGGSDLTPGTIVLRFTNNTGGTITTLNIQYDVLVYNDQGRANSFNTEYSDDGTTWHSIGPLATTTPEAADGSPAWTRSTMGSPYALVTDIAPGATFYVRWLTDDVSGGGSRDEIGIDNIHIAAATYPVELQSLSIE
jgi:hypothetical protein